MKHLALILALLLCSQARADNRVMWPEPREVALVLTWGELPYQHQKLERTISTGEKYVLSNPNGVGCEKWHGGRDVFRCWCLLWRDQAIVLSGRTFNPVW